MRHNRRGFTLIEVLAVIGIILVLVGLLVGAYRHISQSAARRETIAELHICRGMLTDYETHNGLQGIESATAQVKDTNAPAPQMFPVYLDPATTTAQWPIVRVPADTSVPPGDKAQGPPYDVAANAGTPPSTDMSNRSSGGNARYSGLAVQRTRDVMYVLVQIPSNQRIVEAVQAKRILEPVGNATPLTIDKGVVLLDGWADPIIFVPRGGIHVMIKNPATSASDEYVVRSTGTFPAPGGVDPVMTGNERPFFASAGQDGDFTIGEDNVYSFQD